MSNIKNENLLQNTVIVALLAILCNFFWGSAFPCIKIGYELFDIESSDTYEQILFAGIRFTLAGLLVILFQSLIRRRFLAPTKGTAMHIVTLSLFQTILQYFFFYIGLARTSGVKASIINGSGAFLAILVASLVFHHEKLTLRKVVGCILGFTGVIFVNLNNQSIDMNMSFTGEGFIFLCALSYAISSSLIKKYSKTDDSVMLSGYQFLFGGIVLAGFGFICGGRISHISIEGLMMLLYLAFVSALAYTLWGILLKHNPLSKVAVFGFANPVFGVILSTWWLGENSGFDIRVLFSLLLVCAGIVCVNMSLKKSHRKGNCT